MEAPIDLSAVPAPMAERAESMVVFLVSHSSRARGDEWELVPRETVPPSLLAPETLGVLLCGFLDGTPAVVRAPETGRWYRAIRAETLVGESDERVQGTAIAE